MNIALCVMALCMLFLTACGPSEDKIIQAQSTYRNLINTHNAVVAAHAEIKDNSLDEELTALAASIPEIESYNLYEMTDAQIDSLIGTMNTIMDSYAGYLKTIGDIKSAEEAAVLIPVHITLKNETDTTFTGLALYEKNASDENVTSLESLSGFAPDQEMIGLTIYKNSSNTPWIVSLTDKNIEASASDDSTEDVSEEDASNESASDEDQDTSEEDKEKDPSDDTDDIFKIELDVTKYNSDQVILYLKKDEETGKFYIE